MSKEPDFVVAHQCIQTLIDVVHCVKVNDFLNSVSKPVLNRADLRIVFDELDLQYARIRDTLSDITTLELIYNFNGGVHWEFHINGQDTRIPSSVLTQSKIEKLTTLPIIDITPIFDRASTFLRVMRVRLERADIPNCLKLTCHTLTGLEYVYTLNISSHSMVS